LNYWLLTTEYPPAHGGGIGTYCRCTAEMLAESGVHVVVIVADDGVADYTLSSFQQQLEVVRFNPAKRGVPAELGGAAGLSYAFFRIAELLVQEIGAPDLIESQDYLGIAYYLQQFRLLGYPPWRGIPVLITIHAPAFVYWPYNRVPLYRFPEFWTGEMEKHSIRTADLVISPSAFMAEEVEQHMDYGPRAPEILPYAYRPEGSTTVGLGPITPILRNKIVYYGKLSPQKGSFELLRYFEELWADGFPHALHIVGGDDIVYEPEQLTMGQIVSRRFAHRIQSGFLILHGKIKPACIPTVLADAHVVLLPSIVDNLPFACLETMGCGKIMLASMQGGQREIIEDRKNGFLFDHRLPGSFAGKLQEILDLDQEEIARIQQQAAASICRYDYKTIAPRKINLLKSLLSNRPPDPQFPFLRQQPVWLGPQKPLISSRLSVVIPFYNLGAYLDECIHSVLASDWRQLEIILVNDGSTDEMSLEALDHWRDHPEITVIDLVNGGLANARNMGAQRAAGSYLAFLDADDAVLPDYYKKAISVLDRYDNVHFVGSWVRYMGEGAGIWPAFQPEPPYLLVHNPVNSSALVYKTQSFLAAGLNDRQLEFGLEDYESVVNMVSNGLNGVVLPEALHRYRVRRGSMIRSMNRAKLLFSHHYISEKHQEYYSEYTSAVVDLLNSNGPGYLYENPTQRVFVSSSIEKPRSWRSRLRKLARRSTLLKQFLLAVKKKTDRIWQIP
jgi:glycosyltransferase involved in cell wall biosynthesis